MLLNQQLDHSRSRGVSEWKSHLPSEQRFGSGNTGSGRQNSNLERGYDEQYFRDRLGGDYHDWNQPSVGLSGPDLVTVTPLQDSGVCGFIVLIAGLSRI
jgi:hypothetical protein